MRDRQHPRVDLQFPISFTDDGMQGQGEILNLSLKGCAVQSEVSVARGTYLSLELYLPGDADPVNIELASVRWVSLRQFGVEFIRMQGDARQRLHHFVSGL